MAPTTANYQLASNWSSSPLPACHRSFYFVINTTTNTKDKDNDDSDDGEGDNDEDEEQLSTTSMPCYEFPLIIGINMYQQSARHQSISLVIN